MMKVQTKDWFFDCEFYELYDAVKDDNVSKVEEIFAKGDKEKFEILNGTFQLPPLDHGPFNEDIQFVMSFNINRMWHLAVSYGSFKVISLFIQENVNVFQTDVNGNNIFHILASGAFYCPIHEQKKVLKAYYYLINLLSSDVIQSLHMEENNKGLRPLELAAALGTMYLFQAMIHTRGVYHTSCQPYGMYEIHWYDITEYERERTCTSPLIGLMAIEEHKISDKIVHDVYESVLIQHWLTMKKKSLRNFLAISIFGRFVFVAMFLAFMLGKCSMDFAKLEEVTSQVCPSVVFPPWFMHVLKAGLCLGSLMHIVIDSVEVYFFYISGKCDWFLKNPRGDKNTAINFKYYRFVDGTMAVTTLIYALTNILDVHTNLYMPVTLMQLNYAIALITISWSMLHYLELHSHIGVFIMCIQRMFADLFHFLIVFVLFCVPFVYSFSSIVYEDLALAHVKNASHVSHVVSNPYFTNLWKSHYTVFTIILNMVNFDQIGINNNHALYFLHTIFVMIVVILLMNMLIAKFSSSVALVTDNKKVLLTIQTLSGICTYESRYKWLLPKWLYKKLRRDTFPTMDDSLYVRDILIRDGFIQKQAEMRNPHETNV